MEAEIRATSNEHRASTEARSTVNDARFSCLLASLPRSSNPLESAVEVAQRVVQHDGPAVRAGGRVFGAAELPEQPLHLVWRQRHVHLDGGVAGDRGGDLLLQDRKSTRL